jgi:hypothetical protein
MCKTVNAKTNKSACPQPCKRLHCTDTSATSHGDQEQNEEFMRNQAMKHVFPQYIQENDYYVGKPEISSKKGAI